MFMPMMAPSTPTSRKSYGGQRSYSHTPINSSPLAPSSSPTASSPIAAVQARRSQYKPRVSSSSMASSSRSNNAASRVAAYGTASQLGEAGDNSQTAFLRTRLKLRCIERAAKARDRAVQKKRTTLTSSDGMDMDEEENDDDDFQFDDLYNRIMRNAARKTQHAFMYSYDREVGSDPPDEVQSWESELAAESLDDSAELLAYIQEQEADAAFAEFADIPAEDLFSWNDIDDELLSGPSTNADEMDLS
ncbi:hypothetical protein R3P38DRAFT_2920341 [Favolaschia claudopus]|uniref:Uncharacterized protein n=1 Tax=Favolaschia claudopus TaxID=2862362 RepID=A0AAW0C0G9_9AGAR